jgi:hypothetical protein
MVTPPGIPGGWPDSFLEQMRYVFHELHADGCHELCAVCGCQSWPPAESRPATFGDERASAQNDRRPRKGSRT